MNTLRVAAMALLLAANAAAAAAQAPAAPATPGASTQANPARSQKLDQLFAGLKAAKSEEEGMALEGQIVGLWLQSGDAKIDQQMEWALTAMDLGAADLALSYLDSIVLSSPQYVEGWNKRATLYFYLGRFEESLSDIDRTLALEPRHFGAMAGKGMIMEAMGQDQKAIDAFKQALAVDPQLTDVQLEMFLLQDKLKRSGI
jgi:tetratricopeptide (TPR) repeat protein